MSAPRDLLPMAMFALATLVGVGAVVALGELVRRIVLFFLSAVLPSHDPPAERDAAGEGRVNPEGS